MGKGFGENLASKAFLGFPVVSSPRQGPALLIPVFVRLPTDLLLPHPLPAMTSLPTTTSPAGR